MTNSPPCVRARTAPYLTVPNLICYGRIVTSALLVVLAFAEMRAASLAAVFLLFASDWIDGRLARTLNQSTEFGAKVDSVSDLCMFASVLLAVLMLNPHYILDHLVWLSTAVISYCLHVAACLVKFRRWPSYHTRLAKTSWLATAVATVAAFTGWGHWPLRVATIFVTAANIEGIVITRLLPYSQVNVPSFLRAAAMRRDAKSQPELT
jgi:CDP-diacylglycerol--glycerol-3-phosphate 3-phosphatidyltransferase